MARDVLDGPYDGKVDVFSTGIMAAELVVRNMDIAGFARVPASTGKYRFPDQRQALVEDACVRLDAVCPALSAVVRRCCAMKARHRMSSDVALRALNEIDVGGGGGGGSAPAAAPLGGGAVPATSAVPVPAPPTPPGAGAGAGAVQLIDIGDAVDAVAAQQVPADVLNRVFEAMTAVADDDGKVTGAQLMRIVVDEGVGAVAAVAIRRKLGITAPPRGVRGLAAVMLLLCAGVTVCRGS
jgi:hypothetical protein